LNIPTIPKLHTSLFGLKIGGFIKDSGAIHFTGPTTAEQLVLSLISGSTKRLKPKSDIFGSPADEI
jgi:hypothetical protein